MLSDLPTILVWWVFLFGLGLIFLPLARKTFGDFFDHGYLFAKVLGIAIPAYILWLLASLKILPFFQESIWLVLIIGLILNLFLLKKNSLSITRILIIEECLFLVTLIGWSWMRGFQPDIQGLEKFMDFGFVNAILRSKYFPPADMWFAGKFINYYYFGHYVTAFLTKLTGIDSAITYNLMLGTLFAFTFSLAFSLTGNLIYFFLKKTAQKVRWDLILTGAFVAALLISLGGNLHAAYYNFKMAVLRQPYCNGSLSYWYPDATRYIGYCPEVEDKTIHEFPMYSFVVSDLHGHVLNIPFVLTFLATLLSFFLKLREKTRLTNLLIYFFTLSFFLAIFFITNQWDFPIYLLVLGFCLLFSLPFLLAVGTGILIILLSIPLLLPFQLNFEPIISGFDFVRAHSLPHQLLILWGAPWFFGLSFLLFLFAKRENFVSVLAKILNVPVKFIKDKTPLTTYYLLLTTDIFVLVLFLVSTILIIIPEIIYVKDIYIPSYHRANTMFKLTYQSFMMFSLGIGYVIARVLSSIKKGFPRKILFSFYAFFFFSLMVYPYYAVRGYYGNLKPQDYRGLYGLKFLEKQHPDDYQAVLWLNQKILGQARILEAVGDSYTDYGRISMATGLPTVQGWLVHEWLWRGSYDEPGKRSGEVQTIYETENTSEAKEFLDKYKVKYVIVGELEREKYPNIKEEKFSRIGRKVFENGKTAVFELIQ